MNHLRTSLLFVLVVSVFAVSQASLAPQIYWHTKHPKTKMPSSIIQQLLKTAYQEEVLVNAGQGEPGATQADVGVDVNAGHDGTVVKFGSGMENSPFLYGSYAAKASQLHDDASAAIFFQEKDIRPGTKMNLRFYNSLPASTFLPRDLADSIPFSTSKTTEIFSKLSIEPTSAEAIAIKSTLNNCEKPAAKGEDKFCATSLESMVDFAISTLGKDTKVVSTEAAEDSKLRTYTVAPEGVQELKGSKSVTCHRQAYAYSVYYCHQTYETSAYTVRLVRNDGSKVDAVAVCHKDTSEWNPKHLAFQVLNVKPGTVPVCHFLPRDHLVWVSDD